MQSSVWAALLRHVPAEQHNQLMLLTKAGTEITIASLLRIDREIVAIKGRLSGTQDTGRVFFIPFANIDYVAFQQPLKDTDFHDLFDTLVLPEASEALPALPVAPSESLAASAPSPHPPAPPEVASNGNGAPPSFPRLPMKSAVLERFRARTASSPGFASPSPPNE